jgi:MPBQ/MSBQ methyltransferase
MEMQTLSRGSKVLDCGSGLGGPARFVASEYGHDVLGVDLTREYVEAANIISERTAMSSNTRFVEGSVLDLQAAGVQDGCIDAVSSDAIFLLLNSLGLCEHA